MRFALVGGFVCALGFAAPAAATPVTWTFDGSVVASQVAALPPGAPVTVNWTADAAAPNACAATDPAVGIFFGQSVTGTLNGQTFAIDAILTVGTTVSRGCFGPPDTSAALNLVSWSGPNAAEGPLVPFYPCCIAPRMFWSNPVPIGTYPSSPPISAVFQGPFFLSGLGVVSTVQAVEVVPEPTTLSLLLVACLVGRRCIMTRQ